MDASLENKINTSIETLSEAIIQLVKLVTERATKQAMENVQGTT